MIFRSRKHHARHRVEVTVEANVEEGPGGVKISDTEPYRGFPPRSLTRPIRTRERPARGGCRRGMVAL